jgi:hypothetical protein
MLLVLRFSDTMPTTEAVTLTRGDPKITGMYFYYFLFCIFIELYISPLQSIVHVH